MISIKDVRFVSQSDLLGEGGCVFAQNKTCCQICNMGPCQFVTGGNLSEGICGASAETVIARNFCRMVAGGVSTRSVYAVNKLLSFKSVLEQGDIDIDPKFFKRAYRIFRSSSFKDAADLDHVALSWCEEAIKLLGQQNGDCTSWPYLPEERREIWSRFGWTPRGTNREVVEAMHRTHIGVDQEYHSIMSHSSRCALSDLWCSSIISAILTDFNDSSYDANEIDVDVHLLKSRCINVLFYRCDKRNTGEIKEKLKEFGQHDLNFLEVEGSDTGESVHVSRIFTYLVTGALDVIIVGDQRLFNLFSFHASCFHTRVFDTAALKIDNGFLKDIILTYKSRNMRVFIPDSPVLLPVKPFFSLIDGLKTDRTDSLGRRLSQAITNNNLKGIVALVGCIDRHDPLIHQKVVKEFLARDILVLSAGCSTFLLGNAGMFNMDIEPLLGPDIKRFYEATGIYPIINMGVCSEVSRILALFSEMLSGKTDFTRVPAVVFMPSWRSEQIISTGHSLVSSGITTILGDSFPIGPENKATQYITDSLKDINGASWIHCKSNNVLELIDDISRYLEDIAG